MLNYGRMVMAVSVSRYEQELGKVSTVGELEGILERIEGDSLGLKQKGKSGYVTGVREAVNSKKVVFLLDTGTKAKVLLSNILRYYEVSE